MKERMGGKKDNNNNKTTITFINNKKTTLPLVVSVLELLVAHPPH